MKSILCALDFSETSYGVMKKALELAVLRKSALTFLFSYRLVEPLGSALADYRKSMETKARQDFDTLVKRLKINSSVRYEFRSEIGFLSDRIEAFIKKNDVALIVLGQDMVNSINEHKGTSLEVTIQAEKIPLVIVPNEKVTS
jgi:nucleotide-binding universal stress UspA family protein